MKQHERMDVLRLAISVFLYITRSEKSRLKWKSITGRSLWFYYSIQFIATNYCRFTILLHSILALWRQRRNPELRPKCFSQLFSFMSKTFRRWEFSQIFIAQKCISSSKKLCALKNLSGLSSIETINADFEGTLPGEGELDNSILSGKSEGCIESLETTWNRWLQMKELSEPKIFKCGFKLLFT